MDMIATRQVTMAIKSSRPILTNHGISQNEEKLTTSQYRNVIRSQCGDQIFSPPS